MWKPNMSFLIGVLVFYSTEAKLHHQQQQQQQKQQKQQQQQQQRENHHPSPNDYSPYTIGKMLYSDILPILDSRHAHITSLGNNTEQWKSRQHQVKQALDSMFVPLPPASRNKAPKVVPRGSIFQDGVEIQRLLIETRPGYYAPAALYLPPKTNDTNHQKPIPAMLAPSGHDGPAWRDGISQLINFNLASRGIAVLGYDPIGQGERNMVQDMDGKGGSDLNGTEHYGCSFEHEYLQRQISLTGVNAASSWVWDMTILIDYLASNPIIDPAKIGVAGCSGGGVQTAYIGAMDQRVVAASIACYTSTFAVDFAPGTEGGNGPAEGEQQWGPWINGHATTLDKPDLLQIRAPKPTQVLLTTRDQFFPLAGGEAAFTESLPAFVATRDSTDTLPALTLAIGNNSHGYINRTRMALYSFMSSNLLNKTDSGVELYPNVMMDFEQLRVTSTGSVLTAPELNEGNGSLSTHESFVRPIAEAKQKQLQSIRPNPNFIDTVERIIGPVVGFRDIQTVTKTTNISNDTFVVDGEGACKVVLKVLSPTTATNQHSSTGNSTPTVLYVSRKGNTLEQPKPGELSPEEQQRVQTIQAAGFAVVLVDVCGFGTIGDKAGDAFALFDVPLGAFRVKLSQPVDLAFNLNRSVVGIHAGDVLRAATAVVSGLQGFAPHHIVATLSSNETAPAVLAAAIIGKPSNIYLGNIAILPSFASWSLITLAPRYDRAWYFSFVFGVLNHFDIADLVRAVAADVTVMVGGPLDANRLPLSQQAVDLIYPPPPGFSQTNDTTSNLIVQVTQDPNTLTHTILQKVLAKQNRKNQ